ncbi:MAG: hypothetical protein IKF90_21400 [Parasporobacterium sp.]|nr:hypothetical protein [Parasporobacterium sp.]
MKVRKLLKNRIIKKFKSEKGESLSEVLVAVLVSTLGLVMLASMITSSMNIIMNSKTHYENYLKQEQILVGETEGQQGTVKTNKTLSGSEEPGPSIALTGDESDGSIDVYYYKNEEVPDKIIFTYKLYVPNPDGN